MKEPKETIDCQKQGQYCNNTNVRLCQMKSASNPKNIFEDAKLYICKECRQLQQGQFKYVQEPKTDL